MCLGLIGSASFVGWIRAMLLCIYHVLHPYLALDRLDHHVLAEQRRATLQALSDGLALHHQVVRDGGGDDRVVLHGVLNRVVVMVGPIEFSMNPNHLYRTRRHIHPSF